MMIMKLIDKDAVMSIIEQLKDEAIDMEDKARWFLSTALAKRIEALEVKEVDLEERYKDFVKCDNGRSMFETAKHFFELGLSSQLSWKDMELIAKIGMDFMNSEESDNLTEEEYYTEILNRFKAKKGE